MKKLLFAILIVHCVSLSCQGQNTRSAFYNDRITLDAAIGTRLLTFTGSPDIQIAALFQYNLFPKLNFVSHTGISFDIKPSMFKNIDTRHSYTLYERIGIGTTFYSRKVSNAFFITGGAKYYSYSGRNSNPLLAESVSVKSNGWLAEVGLLYNFRWGGKKTFFSGRIFLPYTRKSTGHNIMENMTIELGVGFRIRQRDAGL